MGEITNKLKKIGIRKLIARILSIVIPVGAYIAIMSHHPFDWILADLTVLEFVGWFYVLVVTIILAAIVVCFCGFKLAEIICRIYKKIWS